MIKDRHPSNIGGRRDFVHRHVVEAMFEEEARRNHQIPCRVARRLREAAPGLPDALALIKTDHEEVAKLFERALDDSSKEKASVLEAAEEHACVKDLIAKIKRITGRDETLQAKVAVLKELVEHHVKEEESELTQALKQRRAARQSRVPRKSMHPQHLKWSNRRGKAGH
jgi:hypothetical protein